VATWSSAILAPAQDARRDTTATHRTAKGAYQIETKRDLETSCHLCIGTYRAIPLGPIEGAVFFAAAVLNIFSWEGGGLWMSRASFKTFAKRKRKAWLTAFQRRKLTPVFPTQACFHGYAGTRGRKPACQVIDIRTIQRIVGAI